MYLIVSVVFGANAYVMLFLLRGMVKQRRKRHKE